VIKYETDITHPNKSKHSFFKEKIIVCLSIIKRRIEDVDEFIENGKNSFQNYSISNEEINFLGKENYPVAFIKYI
jgi:hypothetical protein